MENAFLHWYVKEHLSPGSSELSKGAIFLPTLASVQINHQPFLVSKEEKFCFSPLHSPL